MKKIIVTGAAGFAGCNLVEALIKHDCYVYAVVRPGSSHNMRLAHLPNVTKIECDMAGYGALKEHISDTCDMFFHLAWQGGRHDFAAQYTNLDVALHALESAHTLGCKRFICTGSQAEYGLQTERVSEDTIAMPVDAYGAVKLAACALTRERARELGIEWIWGRIFSLYGKYEPSGRMLPDLVETLKSGGTFHMTAATQMWDYLFSADGGEALVALAEKGRAGEIYNIANGDVRPLKEFTDEVLRVVGKGSIIYGDDTIKASAINPSVEKICKDTGWTAATGFSAGLKIGFGLS